MPMYAYKARDNRGTLLRGVLDSTDPAAVADQLMNTGVVPIEITPQKTRAAGDKEPWWQRSLTEEKVGPVELQMFTRQFMTLQKAGVPVMRGLLGLEQSTDNKGFAKVLKDMRESLDAGRDLSASMARHPKVFSAFYISMVRIGEVTGRMNEVFPRLLSHIEFDRAMQNQLKSALRYPSFVITAMIVAMAVINLFVIPSFGKMYEGFKTTLPLMTRILLGISNFTTAYWPYLLGLAVVAGVLFKLWISTSNGRYTWDRVKLQFPIVGRIIMMGTLSRFARSFALSVRSGIPVVQALGVVAPTVDNAYIQSRIDQIRRGVERGESILRTASIAGIFTPVVLQMIAVGDETGELDSLLREVAELYERDVEYEVRTLSAQIEPILLVVLGVMVLVLALGVFLPIWDLGKAAISK